MTHHSSASFLSLSHFLTSGSERGLSIAMFVPGEGFMFAFNFDRMNKSACEKQISVE